MILQTKHRFALLYVLKEIGHQITIGKTNRKLDLHSHSHHRCPRQSSLQFSPFYWRLKKENAVLIKKVKTTIKKAFET